jgi:hypothetical protein
LLETSSFASFENGIHVDFTTNTFYTKVAGQDPVVFPTLQSMFTFTRAAPDATFLGADGLLKTATTNVPRIEYGSARTGTNILLQSQTLDVGATWPRNGFTVSANSAIAPLDGTLTAEVFTENTAGGVHSIDQTINISATTQYTFSVYAKSSNRGIVIKYRDVSDSNGVVAAYNLQTGGVSIVPGLYGSATGVSGTITPVGDGWYRVSITGTLNGGFTSASLSLRAYNGSEGYTGDGVSTLTLWGAQFEPGPVATVYTPTTTAPAYTTSTGNCLGLLMEASKQNLSLNNRDLSAGTWTKSNCTISSSTSIDGTARSVRIVEDSTNSIHGVIAGVTVTANTTYCLSAIVTPQGRQFAYMYGTNTDQFGAIFDFVNLTSAQILAGTSTINQRGIIPFGNGKFLIWVSGVLNAASTVLNFVGGPAISLSSPAGYTYLGDGASGINMEYIQIELGSFPTSRIPTAGSPVTRAAESCTRSLGTEFNATAGTVVMSGRTGFGTDANAQFFYNFDDNTTNERIGVVRLGGGTTMSARIFDGGAAQLASADTVANLTAFKSAVAYASADLAASLNGGALTTAAGALPTLTVLAIGTQVSTVAPANGHIRTFRYYPKRESNAFLVREST